MRTLNFLFVCLVFSFVGCVSSSETLNLDNPSSLISKYKQENFNDYIKETKSWLKQNRIFLTKNQSLEIELNSPYELEPKDTKASKGVLLVHGLGDSPGYFKDIAKELVQQGFLVRVILLPGHGSKPEDLHEIEFLDWKKLISHHIELLDKKVDKVWLGGFSTGANLITSYALDHQEQVSGLLLYSPGFVSDEEDLLPFSGIGKLFKDWVYRNENSKNILRYESLSMNGAYLYYKSLKEVRKKLEKKKFYKPVLITISEHDSVIVAQEILSTFSKKFLHKQSRLIWFGKNTNSPDTRVVHFRDYLPRYNIENISHLAVLFKENNLIYGRESDFKIYNNGQEKEFDSKKDQLWYSAYGFQEDGKYFARLTWNPYFKETINIMFDVLRYE